MVEGDAKDRGRRAEPTTCHSTEHLREFLKRFRDASPYKQPTNWVFASPRMKGKQPWWPETLWRRYGKPAVDSAKILKRVGFHTFRHTYTTLLTQNNEEVKVVQELLRHANSRITLDLYAQAGMPGETIGTEQGCTDGAGQEGRQLLNSWTKIGPRKPKKRIVFWAGFF